MILSMLAEAWSAMGANRLRTFLTMLGMVIGVAAVVAMLAVGQGAQMLVNQTIASMGSNLFIVLSGMLEVRNEEGRIVNVLSAGDAFGEMAFLLERPRSFDVDAVTEDTHVLSLSEGALRKMIADDATVAAKLLLNLSKMLCVRLIRVS